METNTHKSVAIDRETYNILAEAADAECRSISMQIKWLVRNSNSGSPRPTQIPIATNGIDLSVVPQRRKKKVGLKSMEAVITNPNTRLNKCLLKFGETGLTLCSKDFEDIMGKGKEASAELYALVQRGDLERIGNVQPYYYHLTPSGAKRLAIVKGRL